MSKPTVIQATSLNVEDDTELYKMNFIMNALENGWSVKKRSDSFIFSKKHEGKKEVFKKNYLETFIQENFQNRNEK